MALILFAISMFGIMSALRMCAHFRARAVISPQLLTKIGTGSCVIIIASVFFLAQDVIAAFFSIAVGLIMMLSLMWLNERQEIDALKSEVPAFLDRWVLNMKLGLAVSAARGEALRDLSPRATALIEPMFLRHESMPKSHLLLDEKILHELIEASFSPFSSLARLENAREWMRKSDEFRRKSGQAVRQTTIQSVVLLILMFALALFTVHKHGWRRNSDLLTASFVLSGLGVLVMRRMAVKKRWKI